MKIKNLLSFLLIALLTISCSNREEDEPLEVEPNYPLLMKLDSRLLNVSAPISLPDYNFYFEYDNQEKLTKKKGGFLPTSGSTGFDDVFSTDLYTTLIYVNNKVTVENFYNSSIYTVPKNSRYYTINSQFQIVEKEIPGSSFYRYKKQIFLYNNNVLDEIKTTLPNMPYYPPDNYIETYSEKFFYDASKNLVRTEYYELRNGVREGEKIIRTFGDFDNSYNPFKRFTLLDEYFYRSLSKNNFRTYREEITYSYGGFSFSDRSWTFNYDASGNIILN